MLKALHNIDYNILKSFADENLNHGVTINEQFQKKSLGK